MIRITFLLLLFFAGLNSICAQYAAYSKMSSLVKRAVLDDSRSIRPSAMKLSDSRRLCAFVRTEASGRQLLENNGCRVLASFGNIHIADIPLCNIGKLSLNPRVLRIEAGERCSMHIDTTAVVTGADKAWAGESLQCAYTGKGVIMGIQDVGFDLTHPTFYDNTLQNYRIKRFWDFLSADTIGSKLYVGADYTTQESILSYAHSRDGLRETHGTHTLGIAAGSGYDSKYRGIAYNSDICAVSNAVNTDSVFISKEDEYKYTTATDALGFKYIYDYAESQGKPCVISFSEGAPQDFYGECQLMYEVLDSITGPGRILVASAGNDGYFNTYFIKPAGMPTAGSFLINTSPYIFATMRADKPFSIRMTVYRGETSKEGVIISSQDVVNSPDSLLSDTLTLMSMEHVLMMAAYPSCYDKSQMIYEIYVRQPVAFGMTLPVSIEVMGEDACVELFRGSGYLVSNAIDYELCAGQMTHSIHYPASAPSVIAVGATAYRKGHYNYNGVWKESDWGVNGVLAGYSSVGPNYMGNVKPDVVAPGTNVISSYSSYYMENNPEASDVDWNVRNFEYNGRVYGWNSNTGTSMSAPVVGGTIALWLEACPSLTPEDVMGIIERTSARTESFRTYPNNYCGYGEINAYKGLLDILGVTAIDGISDKHPQRAHISIKDRGLVNILFDDFPTEPVKVSVYSSGGVLVDMITLGCGITEHSIDLSRMPDGVYIIQLTSRDKSITGSQLVRL